MRHWSLIRIECSPCRFRAGPPGGCRAASAGPSGRRRRRACRACVGLFGGSVGVGLGSGDLPPRGRGPRSFGRRTRRSSGHRRSYMVSRQARTGSHSDTLLEANRQLSDSPPGSVHEPTPPRWRPHQGRSPSTRRIPVDCGGSLTSPGGRATCAESLSERLAVPSSPPVRAPSCESGHEATPPPELLLLQPLLSSNRDRSTPRFATHGGSSPAPAGAAGASARSAARQPRPPRHALPPHETPKADLDRALKMSVEGMSGAAIARTLAYRRARSPAGWKKPAATRASSATSTARSPTPRSYSSTRSRPMGSGRPTTPGATRGSRSLRASGRRCTWPGVHCARRCCFARQARAACGPLTGRCW